MVKMEVTVLFKRVIESTTTSLDVQSLDNIQLANTVPLKCRLPPSRATRIASRATGIASRATGIASRATGIA